MDSNNIKSVHFIGIGGVGMSGIARVAHDQGMTVTGSDMKESRYTRQLKEAGVKVAIGQHSASNIPGTGADDGPDVVVVTTAVLDNNPELIAAKERGLTIWHRAQMLARLGVGLDTVAIAGTHGKTTTSSMVASALDKMGVDPTFLIGGIVRSYGSNAHSGTGRYYVVEADESDKSFRYLSPAAVLVTNIEADHLDHYRDLDEIHEKFQAFIASTAEGGPIV
ncbi:MAG: UDP-N-acetylmuramate--L-alanine ligase, partial [Eggerthellaceae bacterium]|nr:UDP-N-acetylmuramate--L-alanine ligase [Eggerthellaceae bacterium]